MWNSWSLCIDASFSAAAWEHKYYKRRSRSCNVYLMYWLCIYWFFSLIDNLPRCQGFHHSLTHTKKNTYEIHSLSLLQVNTRKTKKKTKPIQEIENHYLVSRNERQIQRRIEKGGNRVISGGGELGPPESQSEAKRLFDAVSNLTIHWWLSSSGALLDV